MKVRAIILGLALAAAAVAGAQAQGSMFGHKVTPKDLAGDSSFPPWPGQVYRAPPAARVYAPQAPMPPEMPGSAGFKPYQPFQGSSVYGAPKPASTGAKPCETSVYINACDKRR